MCQKEKIKLKKTLSDPLEEDKDSVEEKKKSMMKHLDFMLKNFDLPESIVTFDDCIVKCPTPKTSRYKTPKSFKDIGYEHVSSFHFVGRVVSFFAQHACRYFITEKGLIEYESATGYLSSFKTYFQLKFKEMPPCKPFEDAMWKRYRSKVSAFNVFF